MRCTQFLFGTRPLVGFFFFWVVGILWNFVVRLDENYDGLVSLYQEATKKVNSDCQHSLQSTDFVKECTAAKAFLSRTRVYRAFTLTVGQTGFCGKENCIEYLLGPSTYFGSRYLQICSLLGITILFLWFFLVLFSMWIHVI
jgi:hypothetical protein